MSPAAYIAVSRDKNRLKIYGDQKVYLKDGQEFIIELHNPTQETIGAKVYINGKAISDRLVVLKPGERSWLERYIDTDSRFVFGTYHVENTDVAKNAIANNGYVKVEFFREQEMYCNDSNWVYPWIINPTPTYPIFNPNVPCYPSYPIQPYYYYGATGIFSGCSGTSVPAGYTGTSGPVGCAGTYSDGNVRGFCSSNTGTSVNTDSFASNDNASTYSANLNESIETGRVERGQATGKGFSNYNGVFTSFSFASTEYQILPESGKPVEISQLRQYCPECRTRIKKSGWKFCPSCGEKLD